MKANETKLQMIIEGTKQFVVPLFQRPYIAYAAMSETSSNC
jgi:hypothetical protein